MHKKNDFDFDFDVENFLKQVDRKPSDCELIVDDVENLFSKVGDCLDAAIDERRGKGEVVRGLFGVAGGLLKLGVRGTGCLIKNTPKAITAVASAKRELTEGLAEEYRRMEKERRERELGEKIARLAHRKKS